MWRLAVLFTLAPPAFAISDGLANLLKSLAPDAALVAGGVLLVHVSIAGLKILLLNFVKTEDISKVDSFEKFSLVADSGADWRQMTTKIDFHVEAPDGDLTLPDIDPSLLAGFDDIDQMLFDDMAEDSMH